MNVKSKAGALKIWTYPIVLAIVTILGLLSALLGEGGIWWPVSWVALATPLAAIAISLLKQRRPSAATKQS